MSERRKAREKALELLYQRELSGQALPSMVANRKEAGESSLPPFSLGLVQGVLKHSDEIDSLIKGHSEGWVLERMPVVDRNIIRLGIYEILFEDEIPVSVSINEAVELAKTYGTRESGKFINGILGRIAQEREVTVEESESG